MPQELLEFFENNGAFAAHLTSRPGHAIAMDEAHETVINKIIKDVVTRPSPELMEHVCHALPFRHECQAQLKKQLGLDDTIRWSKEESKCTKVANVNIAKMLDLIEAKQILDISGTTSLANKITNVIATPDQQHDLLAFRAIGQVKFENHVACRILQKPSAQAPSRLKKLKTFTVCKSTKQKAKQIDKERKIIENCTKKQLAMYRSGKPSDSKFNPPYIVLPRALADENGNPHKANKSTPTSFFKNRYCENNVITNEFPPNWMPDSVLLEGMFMIQTTPILGVVKFADYSKLLTHHYILPHFKNGVKEVHVIFDQ